jgi:dihydropteroate synthase
MNNFSTTGSLFSKNFSLNLGGQILDLASPRIMGIINVTPDSFYGESRMAEPVIAVRVAREMLQKGAAILDVGAMSSRPGAEFVSEAEELDRLMPVLEALKHEVPGALISVDTWRSGIAREASSKFGIHMINDISSGDLDPDMFTTVASLGLSYVMMHKQGDPSHMQENPEYRDVVDDLLRYFADRIFTLRKLGVKDIIIDPGFGFGKTLEHNYQLLRELGAFRMLELPLMVGVSRKSLICKALQVNPENALNGTTAAHMAALLHGANILRVHDVQPAAETVKIFQHIVKDHSRQV